MRNYFCGWYLKCQNETQALALIPAYHITDGRKSCSIQLITDDGAWNVPFFFESYHQDGEGLRIGGNVFTRQGVTLALKGPGLQADGKLTFGPFAPIGYDVMGPFRYVPFMQCRHSVLSMGHRVRGSLRINGRVYDFADGICYIEGDRGRSFPSRYVWSQCCFPDGSLMLSVADIPFCGFHFTGVIGVIHYKGREYRLGTYLGARAVKLQGGEVVICQGSKRLTVRQLERKGHPLAAPVAGSMVRTIHESAACKAYFCYEEKGRKILEFTHPRVAFEYEYPQ